MSSDIEEGRRRLPKRPGLTKGFSWSAKIFVVGILLGVVSALGMHLYSTALPTQVISVIGETIVGRVELYKRMLIYEILAIFLNNALVALASSLLPIIIGVFEARPEKPSKPRESLKKQMEILNKTYLRIEGTFFKSGAGLEPKARSLCFSMLLLPTVIMIVNGWILGYFGAAQAVKSLPNLLFFLALVLPHGVIEIPAFILAAAIGYWMIQKSMRYFETGKYDEFPRMAREMLRDRLTWYALTSVLAFLLAAAYIETYITPYVPASLQLM